MGVSLCDVFFISAVVSDLNAVASTGKVRSYDVYALPLATDLAL
jgi:hypothetical protein